MKANLKIQKITTVQNNPTIKLIAIGITVISTFILSGCQETAMTLKTSLPTPSLTEEKIYAMAEFSSDYGVCNNETTQNNSTGSLYLVGTKTYAEKLMSMYGNNEKHRLNTSTNRLGNEVNRCVPIMMIAF